VKRGLNEACNERACIALFGCACKQLIGDFEQYQFKYKSKRFDFCQVFAQTMCCLKRYRERRAGKSSKTGVEHGFRATEREREGKLESGVELRCRG